MSNPTTDDGGVRVQWAYDGDAEMASFPSSKGPICVKMPFRTAQRIGDELEARYRAGVRDGIAAARREIQALERANG